VSLEGGLTDGPSADLQQELAGASVQLEGLHISDASREVSCERTTGCIGDGGTSI
jgi:hypothetical protein